MKLIVCEHPVVSETRRLQYFRDDDTGILSARIDNDCAEANRPADQSVIQIATPDGGWLHLELEGGRLRGVEIAIWPQLRRMERAVRAQQVPQADVSIQLGGKKPSRLACGLVELNVDASVDDSGRALRLAFDKSRSVRLFAPAPGMLVGVNAAQELSAIHLSDIDTSQIRNLSTS